MAGQYKLHATCHDTDVTHGGCLQAFEVDFQRRVRRQQPDWSAIAAPLSRSRRRLGNARFSRRGRHAHHALVEASGGGCGAEAADLMSGHLVDLLLRLNPSRGVKRPDNLADIPRL